VGRVRMCRSTNEAATSTVEAKDSGKPGFHCCCHCRPTLAPGLMHYAPAASSKAPTSFSLAPSASA
jgi:hypothetical protein